MKKIFSILLAVMLIAFASVSQTDNGIAVFVFKHGGHLPTARAFVWSGRSSSGKALPGRG